MAAIAAGMARPSVTAQADVREGGGGRLLATAVLNVNLETGNAPRWSRRSVTLGVFLRF